MRGAEPPHGRRPARKVSDDRCGALGPPCAWARFTMSGPHDLFARYTFGHPEPAAAEPPRRAAPICHLGGGLGVSAARARQRGGPGTARDRERPALHGPTAHRPPAAAVRLARTPVLGGPVDGSAHAALRGAPGGALAPEHPESALLPLIIPLVMYHGPEGAWTAPRRVEDLFDLPEGEEQQARWRALVPRFEYLLDDLTAEREAALTRAPARRWSGWPGWSYVTGVPANWPGSCQIGWRSSRRCRQAPRGPSMVVVIRYLLWVGDKAAVRGRAGVIGAG